jgi:hypothetical protein
MTFINWLKTQHERDDQIGDLARDLLNDPCALYLITSNDLVWHAHKVHKAPPSSQIVGIVARANTEWEATE